MEKEKNLSGLCWFITFGLTVIGSIVGTSIFGPGEGAAMAGGASFLLGIVVSMFIDGYEEDYNKQVRKINRLENREEYEELQRKRKNDKLRIDTNQDVKTNEKDPLENNNHIYDGYRKLIIDYLKDNYPNEYKEIILNTKFYEEGIFGTMTDERLASIPIADFADSIVGRWEIFKNAMSIYHTGIEEK